MLEQAFIGSVQVCDNTPDHYMHVELCASGHIKGARYFLTHKNKRGTIFGYLAEGDMMFDSLLEHYLARNMPLSGMTSQ